VKLRGVVNETGKKRRSYARAHDFAQKPQKPQQKALHNNCAKVLDKTSGAGLRKFATKKE
jgi:hypothetical protein